MTCVCSVGLDMIAIAGDTSAATISGIIADEAAIGMVERMLPYLKKGAILTDAGSTKQYVWEHLKKILPPDIYYVSGHPMTGKEKSGVQAADKDLFVNKCYVIVEDTGAPREVLDRVVDLLRLTGANLTTLDIAKHGPAEEL